MESRKLLILKKYCSATMKYTKSNIFKNLLLTTRGNQKLTQNVTKSRDVRGGITNVKKVDESQEQKLTRLNKEPTGGGSRRIVSRAAQGGWRTRSISWRQCWRTALRADVTRAQQCTAPVGKISAKVKKIFLVFVEKNDAHSEVALVEHGGLEHEGFENGRFWQLSRRT